MQEVAKKRGLRKHCRFHTSVDKAEWDANANVWRIEIRDVRTGEKQMTRATALVSAIGVLVVPSFPKLQGIESFKGEVFHSARWNHSVNLHGKRVAVVGNGSSAYVGLWSGVLHVALILPLRAQFVPNISADPTVSVVNFARTAMWYVPSVSTLVATTHIPSLICDVSSHTYPIVGLQSGFLRTFLLCNASIDS